MFLSALLSIVAPLAIVIFVHELGHFLAAKARGVKVIRFSLGFGPKLFAFTRGDTEYRLSWVPLGGYVQMAGDTPDDSGEMPTGADAFLSHPWPGRLIIAVAGPAANLVTAFLVFSLTAMIGVSYQDYENRLGPVADTSAAFTKGVREGDRIVAVGDSVTATWRQLEIAESKVADKLPLTVVAERAGRRFQVPLAASERAPFFASLEPTPLPAVIRKVLIGMPAYKAGLRDGDKIVALDDRPIRYWQEIPQGLKGKAGKEVTLMVDRNGTTFPVKLTPMSPNLGTDADGRIGIEAPRPRVSIERSDFFRSVAIGFGATLALVPAVYEQMWLVISHPVYYREYLGGPVFIAQAAYEQAQNGLDSWLQLLAWINVAIMAFNLLPLPVLDGGHIALALIEGIRRHALSAKTYLRFQKAGLVVVLSLFVFIVANDFNRLFQRQRALTHGPHPAPRETPVAPSPP